MVNSIETKQQLLESDEFVLSETKKIQELFKLKEEPRYHLERNEEIFAESVADHVYAMHTLADYFLPFEDEAGQWDQNLIHTMITYHDIDEIETGDTIGYMKTPQMRASEAAAAERVISTIPESMQAMVKETLATYEAQDTPEARFVKALDKIEVVFHMYTDHGRKIFAHNRTTREQHVSVKDKYVEDFPTIKRFCDVVSEQLEKEGFYYQE